MILLFKQRGGGLIYLSDEVNHTLAQLQVDVSIYELKYILYYIILDLSAPEHNCTYS